MLRYKNSLLERILLEKGIDVQAELRLKTGAPGATAKPAMPPKAAPGPTARPAQRLPGGITSKPDAFAMSQRDGAYGVPSPQFQATPTSHVSSPSHAKSPGFGFQGAMSPVGVEQQGGRPQLLPQPRTFNNQTSPPAISMPQTDPTDKPRGARGQRVAAQYYPSPFQKHYDQLGKSLYVTSYCESVKRLELTPFTEQEYDAQADMVDEDHDGSVNASYLPGFTPQSVTSGSHSLSGFNPPPGGDGGGTDFGAANQLLGQYEPMLDADPFGLSASMHFPTPFNYEQNNPRN